MKVQVEALDSVRKKVEVLLPRETVSGIRESIYDEIRRSAKIKGFRQGKVPRPIITQYYKEYIEEETRKRMLQNTMFDALKEANVEPITEPVADFLEGDEPGYTLDCEVLPEIELPEYKGIEIEAEPINISDADVEQRIESMRQFHASFEAKQGEATAQKGDFVVIKYQGYRDGEALKQIAADGYPLELGNAMLMPEFENAVIGMKEGEERDVDVTFPDDYPDKDIASKKILFKVTMKEIKQKVLPEVNDEFARDMSFENLEVMRKGVREELIKEKEGFRKSDLTRKALEVLLRDREIPVPKRFLEKRVHGMIEEAQSRYQTDRLSAEELQSISERMHADFGKRAEDRIKAEIVLARIAEKEDIKADDKDVEERLKTIAEDANKTYNEVKGIYEQYGLVAGLRDNIVEEKAIDFVLANAVVKDAPKENE
ncbi:MAG TPA: trigger factor [Syntrophorhabdaceae bacterium]|nr:trigger factor [Syntrophorhabdaceae bacterium]